MLIVIKCFHLLSQKINLGYVRVPEPGGEADLPDFTCGDVSLMADHRNDLVLLADRHLYLWRYPMSNWEDRAGQTMYLLGVSRCV